MKKVLIILGSPRRNGNSTILAGRVRDGVLAAGGACEVVYLNAMKIGPCQGCDSCLHDENRRCAVNDDMQCLYPKLQEADALLLAGPIYMFSVSAQLKLFLDRCYCCLRSFKGKRIGIVLTYGDTDEHASGAVNAMNTLKDLFRFTRSEIVGLLHGSAMNEGDIASNSALLEQACELGRVLAEPS